MNFRLKQLVEAYKDRHVEVRSQDLAEKILPEKTPNRAREQFSRWCSGATQTGITPDVIIRICETLNVTPNQLFNHE